MTPRWRTRLAQVGALLALLLLTAGFYWKLTISRQWTYLEGPDLANVVRPWLDFEAREFHAGRFPLWEPYEWAGHTLIGQVQPGITNPLNWILFAMPLRDGHMPLTTLHWYWVLIHWLGAVFCYALCRDLGAGHTASLLGGCVFALAGFLGHTDWPQILMSSIWVPLVLLFFARAARGRTPASSAALCGAALGMAFLSGHHVVPTFTMVLVGALWLVYLVLGLVGQADPEGTPPANRSSLDRELAGENACPTISPSRQGRKTDPGIRLRNPGTDGTASEFPAKGAGNPWQSRQSPEGTVAGGAVFHEVSRAERPSQQARRPVLLHAAIFASVWLLVSAVQVLPAIEYGKQALRWAGAPEPLRWGQPVPYYVHAQYSLGWPSVGGIVLPGISLHANPHVGFVAVALALAALWYRRRDARVRWFGLVAVGGLLLALGKDFPPYWLIYRFVPMVEKAREPAMAIVLCQVGIAALAALGVDACRRAWRRGWIAVLALGLFLGEAVYDAPRLARFDRPGSYAALIRAQADIAEFLKAQPGWFRVDFDANDVPYNFGNLYGIEQFGGGGSSLPLRTHRWLGNVEAPRLFGIRYWVGRRPSDPAQQEVFRSRSGLAVYRDPRVVEPLWTWRSLPCAAPDRLRVVSRHPERFVIEADLGCPGLVVEGDSYYPGWRAWVDGERRPVQELDAVRAVRSGAGRHVIEFRYRPASVYWGVGLTMLGFSIVALLCWRARSQ